MDKDLNTEEKIIAAAKDVFSQKGMQGARMQEIADKANINKALLHYYFRTKEKLFESIVEKVATVFFPSVLNILTKDASLEEKITAFANGYITFIQKNPYLPNFVMNLLNQNPEKLVSILKISDVVKKLELQQQIDREAKAGHIRHVDAYQLIINLLSLCIFPFIGRPIIKVFMNVPDRKYDEFIEERKRIVPEVILSWLKPIDRRHK